MTGTRGTTPWTPLGGPGRQAGTKGPQPGLGGLYSR